MSKKFLTDAIVRSTAMPAVAAREHAKSWGLVSMATPGCGSSIASLTHRTAFARPRPVCGPATYPSETSPHDFACSLG